LNNFFIKKTIRKDCEKNEALVTFFFFVFVSKKKIRDVLVKIEEILFSFLTMVIKNHVVFLIINILELLIYSFNDNSNLRY